MELLARRMIFCKLTPLALIFCLFTICCESKPPHVIFILADDYGFNDVGYHGSEIKTPNIDKLSGGGVRLENYYVQPICSPTRTQLMSGKYQVSLNLLFRKTVMEI